jgi:hypothetical protein
MTIPTDSLKTAKNRATDMANDAKDQIATSAREQAETARDHTVETVENAAHAAEAAGQEFDSDSLQAAALEQLGAQINSVAAGLRNKPVDEMVDDVAVFARKNPILFLGGAALIGFAAARFLKSGESTRNANDDETDPWSGHLQTLEASQ